MVDFLYSLLEVGTQVAILFIFIGVGFAISKFGVIDKKGTAQITDILFYIVTPAVIINAFCSVDFSKERLLSLLFVAICASFVYVIGIVLSAVIFRGKPAFMKLGTVFSNCGFMSLPLAMALFGETGVFLVSVYIIIHNIFMWTYGISLCSDEKLSLKRALFNPGTIGVIIGLPLFILGVNLPEMISVPLNGISGLNTPLAMIVIGFYLSKTKPGVEKGDGAVLLVTVMRLIAVPALALLAFSFVPIYREVLYIIMLPACAPTAANTAMFAAKFSQNPDSSSRVVSLTTVASILTMPIFMAISKMIFT